MTIRAVIFDVYRTLLEVGPPPADADARWEQLWRGFFHESPPIRLTEFGVAAQPIIAREHAAARAAGIAYPEIYWPDVAAEASPALTKLAADARLDFLTHHAALVHTVRLSTEAAELLRMLRTRNLALGIASNAQPYTVRELHDALAGAGLPCDIFPPPLCFWSFEHGFSKPDPHVFRLLTARLRARGITPVETLMVGDRLDNDIEPARAQGWQTWHLTPDGWQALHDWLQHQ